MQMPVWVALYLVVPALCLIGVSSKKDDQNTLSKGVTGSLRGIGMLLIVFVHTIEGYINSETFFFYVSGVLGVSSCFLVSGYGLFKSFYRKQNYLQGFLQTKVLRMLLPYALLYIVFLAYRIFKGDTPSLQTIVTELIALRMDGMLLWYLKIQILCYVIFYLSYKFLSGEKTRLTAIFLGIILWMAVAKLLNLGASWYKTCLFFPLGLVLAKYEETILCILRRPVCILGCTVATIFMFLMIYFFGRFGLDLLYDWIYMLTFNGAMIGMLLYIRGSCLLSALSKYSMEVYLLHLLLLLENPFHLYHSDNGVSHIAILLLSMVTAMPIYFLCNKFLDRIRKHYA